MIQEQITNIKQVRKFLLNIIEELSIEQLNKIPEGFNNNIFWNIGHIVVAQQGLCYVRAGLAPHIDEAILNDFKSGTKPTRSYTEAELSNMKSLLFSTLDELEQDISKNYFEQYVPFNTRYDIEMKNVEDAVAFILFHEGLHLGYITAMKKLVL